MPSKNGELCDQCSSQLITRSDETDEVIKERLGVYQKETLPLIETYRQKGILLEVNGEQSVGTIHLEILKNLGS